MARFLSTHTIPICVGIKSMKKNIKIYRMFIKWQQFLKIIHRSLKNKIITLNKKVLK